MDVLVKEGRRKSALERFNEKWIEVAGPMPEPCWCWTGCVDAEGYSRFCDGQALTMGHRWVMQFIHGPIPSSMQVDHLCSVRHCVRPEHLVIVTQQVNLARGLNANREKTHCLRGHAYEGDNLYISPAGKRECNECRRERRRLKRQLAKQGGIQPAGQTV